MKDKRGKWTKKELKDIWENYNINIGKKIFYLTYGKKIDLNEKTYCAYCWKIILRCAYQGSQPNSKYSWNVDHINFNPFDNSLNNLQPMHPWCNERKSNPLIGYKTWLTVF